MMRVLAELSHHPVARADQGLSSKASRRAAAAEADRLAEGETTRSSAPVPGR